MNLIFLYFVIVLILVSGYLLERILITTFSVKVFRIFVAPGIVIHEFSHMIAAKMVGSQVKDFRFFLPEGGYVAYTKPKIPLIGNTFVSLAPLIIGSFFILLIGYFLKLPLNFNLNEGAFRSIEQIFRSIDFLQIQTILLLYLIMSIAASLAPSKTDFKIAWLGLIPFIIITIVLYYLIPPMQIVFAKLASMYFLAFVLILVILLISTIIFIIHQKVKK